MVQMRSPDILLKEVNYDYSCQVTDTQSEGTYLGSKTGGVLSTPIGVAVSHDGFVYVTSKGTASILKYDPSLSYVSTPIGPGSPRGICIDQSGSFYVLSGNYIRTYNSSGTLIQSFTHAFISNPYGIAVSNEGLIYVTSPGAVDECTRILCFTSNGTFVAQKAFPWTIIVVPGGAGGYYTQPYGVSIDSDGTVWVTAMFIQWSTAGNNAAIAYLYEFTPTLSPISYSTIISGYTYEPNIAISNSQDRYVSTPNQIKNCTSGSYWGNFSTPRGIAIGETAIYVMME
jgi:hypothetical protein